MLWYGGAKYILQAQPLAMGGQNEWFSFLSLKRGFKLYNFLSSEEKRICNMCTDINIFKVAVYPSSIHQKVVSHISVVGNSVVLVFGEK